MTEGYNDALLLISLQLTLVRRNCQEPNPKNLLYQTKYFGLRLSYATCKFRELITK